jgi:hypothetical protein
MLSDLLKGKELFLHSCREINISLPLRGRVREGVLLIPSVNSESSVADFYCYFASAAAWPASSTART